LIWIIDDIMYKEKSTKIFNSFIVVIEFVINYKQRRMLRKINKK